MAKIKPFRGVRPAKELAEKVASPPYDVLNSVEAKEMAGDNPISFLHVVKPEIDLPDDISPYDDRVYAKAAENFKKLLDDRVMLRDDAPYFYLYEQTMDHIVQVGLVAAASVDDYEQDIIKKHELTRASKEQDRTRHVDTLGANTGPVFLTYKAQQEIDDIVEEWIKREPVNDFVAPDKVRHRFWVVDDQAIIDDLAAAFEKIGSMYVSDGHHRSASACNVRKVRKDKNPTHNGSEAYNYFLTVIFPDNQLRIFDYNRVVKDLNGLSSSEFVAKIREKFLLEEWKTGEPYKPKARHNFGVYFDNQWYKATAKPGSYDESDPIDRLDVQILQKNVLDSILNIRDPRTDKRIDFVGGIRGLKELERRVHEDDYTVAFSLHPTSIEDLIKVADAGLIMPPKSTWFEPKLRSGLVAHLLDCSFYPE
ncbi:MAG: hypothetical protein B6244_00665 [Candidatus Cloacimonetes bacterium 4572_55]|nr:MAG: hypothetical protein B6244_00665 [Candidatus Cloacimonetes bacterium 4572_55]